MLINHPNILSSTGEFWLICNNRPFYATYNNGNVSIGLNGWSWLKNTEHWNDLKDCDFYDSEKIDNDCDSKIDLEDKDCSGNPITIKEKITCSNDAGCTLDVSRYFSYQGKTHDALFEGSGEIISKE